MPSAEATCRPLLALAVLVAIAYLCVHNLLPLFLGSSSQEQGGTGLLGVRLRKWLSEAIGPLGDELGRWGVKPSMLTGLQILLSLVVGWAYLKGFFFTAGWMLIGSGSLDVLDGYMARKSGEVSDRGAFIDSVGDRYAELFPFLGLALFYQGHWLSWVSVLALLGGLLVSYMRARAAGLGVDCRVGMMQRPERYVVLGFGSIFDVLFGNIFCLRGHPVLVASVVVIAILTHATAIERAAFVLKRLD